MTNLNEKMMWTIEELAAYTGYKISYLRKLCSKGKVKYHIPDGGRRIFFCKDEIMKWLTGYTTRTKAEITNEIKTGKDEPKTKK